MEFFSWILLISHVVHFCVQPSLATSHSVYEVMEGRSVFGAGGLLSGRADGDPTSTPPGAEEECPKIPCDIFNEDPEPCGKLPGCTYCCSKNLCMTTADLASDPECNAVAGCMKNCGNPTGCLSEGGCSFDLCKDSCHDAEDGCPLLDGLPKDQCLAAGCVPCCKDGYTFCFPYQPDEECDLQEGPAGLTGTFFEACSARNEYANISLPIKRSCTNIPQNANVKQPPVTPGKWWGNEISVITLPEDTCLMVYDSPDCTGDSVRTNTARIQLCDGYPDSYNFNDKIQSYIQIDCDGVDA